MSPSISTRTPVRIGRVSPRSAATETWATAWVNRWPSMRAAGLGRGRQRRVVVGRHHQQAEARGPARHLDLRTLGGDVDRAVGEVAGDVGEQPAEHEHGPGLGDLGRDGDPRRDLVVERRQGQGALVVGPQEDAGEHRYGGTRRQPAGHPGDRLGQDVALDAELHGTTTFVRRECRARFVHTRSPSAWPDAQQRRRRRRGHDTSARLDAVAPHPGTPVGAAFPAVGSGVRGVVRVVLGAGSGCLGISSW